LVLVGDLGVEGFLGRVPALEVVAFQGFVLAQEDVRHFGLARRPGRRGVDDHGDVGQGGAGHGAQGGGGKQAGSKGHGRPPQNTKSMPRLMISPSKSGMLPEIASAGLGMNMPSKLFSVLTCLYSPLRVRFGARL